MVESYARAGSPRLMTEHDVTAFGMEDHAGYDRYLESMRCEQYPMLKNALYLDHAGMSLPSRFLLDAVHADLLNTLYGNPHSASAGTDAATQRIQAAREHLLKFFNADAENYDLVFTANATASIKIIGEGLRELPGKFSYGYHVDSHTSIVGLRELARQSQCLVSSESVEAWIAQQNTGITLFAYPAQSNMDGTRLPLAWCKYARDHGVYTLLDAAAFASTSQLDIDASAADFTVISLYKIFGYPDLGALIVKKSAAHLLHPRKYFGGGTVDAVGCVGDQWHARSKGPSHEQLEDGTLPVHSIVALRHALDAHAQLFGSLERISKHTLFLTRQLASSMAKLRHGTGRPVCKMYTQATQYEDSSRQGPTIAFNLLDKNGAWLSTAEVEKVAAVHDIHLRVGAVCNPGGVAQVLGLTSADIRSNFEAGYRCGGSNELMNERPTGIIRVSFGCTSTISDVQRFLAFLHEYFTSKQQPLPTIMSTPKQLQIESLTIYPIKSCAGWSIPYQRSWTVRPEGLAWDREWCIVQSATGAVLSQKQYPRMALIRPEIDTPAGTLRIHFSGSPEKLSVPLVFSGEQGPDVRLCSADVCDETVKAQRYTSNRIAEVLSVFLGTSCTLARFPAVRTGQHSSRHSKDHLTARSGTRQTPLLLSNESPVLVTTRSSLDAVNEALKARGKRAAHHSVFRANVILSELPSRSAGTGQPWLEDEWQQLQFLAADGTVGAQFDALGGCRRCQMVCVDQLTGDKRPEIFLTLAKQRRIEGKVLFGIHCAPQGDTGQSIKVGDLVDVS